MLRGQECSNLINWPANWGKMASSSEFQSDSRAPAVVQFGIFELNRRAGELRKHGTRIRLQPKPMHLLCALLERPGETVTRDELKAPLSVTPLSVTPQFIAPEAPPKRRVLLHWQFAVALGFLVIAAAA